MLGVLLEVGIPQVEVAQLSVGDVAVVGVGTHHVAQHTHVVAIQRTNHGQRVILGIRALDVVYLAALLGYSQS